jgi:hypothetical protein
MEHVAFEPQDSGSVTFLDYIDRCPRIVIWFLAAFLGLYCSLDQSAVTT